MILSLSLSLSRGLWPAPQRPGAGIPEESGPSDEITWHVHHMDGPWQRNERIYWLIAIGLSTTMIKKMNFFLPFLVPPAPERHRCDPVLGPAWQCVGGALEAKVSPGEKKR